MALAPALPSLRGRPWGGDLGKRIEILYYMTLVHATPKFWTREEYRRLTESGFFGQSRVELIEGEIVSMPPQGPEHVHSIGTLTNKFVLLFGDTHYVYVQLPLDLGNSQPEPDFAFVPMASESKDRLPVSADLVIEVSKTSLAYDRHEKSSLYAKAGIIELWILNLDGGTVEVHRRPGAGPEYIFGHGYGSVERFRGEERISPLFFPGVSLTATELLS